MYYRPARNHGPASNFPIVRIVMHGTVSPCLNGQARATAAMFATTTRDASTQYVVDPGEIVQCVPDNVVAYGAPPNQGSIHIEQCDPQVGSPSRWQDAAHQAMLKRAALLVASLCQKYHIPVVKLSSADLLAGKRGICGHSDISAAWHQTDHTDPGVGYPWSQLLALVNEHLHPTPAPAPKVPKVKRMLLIKDPTRSGVFLTDFLTKHWVRDPAEETHILNGFKIVGLPAEVFKVTPGSILSSYGLIDSGGFPTGYTNPLPTDVEH